MASQGGADLTSGESGEKRREAKQNAPEQFTKSGTSSSQSTPFTLFVVLLGLIYSHGLLHMQ